VRRVRPDATARVEELSTEAVERIESLAPFGAGNPRVRLMLEGVTLGSNAEPFGRTGSHASIHVRDPRGERVVRVIGWDWFDRLRGLRAGASIDCVVEPKLSRWRDRVRVEPVIVDLCVRD